MSYLINALWRGGNLISKLYMEMLEAWEDIRECRNIEGELINPIIISNRNICLKGKMIFDASLYAK